MCEWLFTLRKILLHSVTFGNRDVLIIKTRNLWEHRPNVTLVIQLIYVFLFLSFVLRWFPATLYPGRIVLSLAFILFCLRLLHIFTISKTLGPKIIIVKRMVSCSIDKHHGSLKVIFHNSLFFDEETWTKDVLSALFGGFTDEGYLLFPLPLGCLDCILWSSQTSYPNPQRETGRLDLPRCFLPFVLDIIWTDPLLCWWYGVQNYFILWTTKVQFVQLW